MVDVVVGNVVVIVVVVPPPSPGSSTAQTVGTKRIATSKKRIDLFVLTPFSAQKRKILTIQPNFLLS
jgi:hypothetical protein